MFPSADVMRNPQIHAVCSALFSLCRVAIPNLRLEGCAGIRMQFLVRLVSSNDLVSVQLSQLYLPDVLSLVLIGKEAV